MADNNFSYSNPLCGIYRIFHKETGKSYIGSSATIYIRWTAHKSKLSRNEHHSKYLQRAWNKYGKDAFSFEIVELCELENLLDRENHFIGVYQANTKYGYNSAPVAGSLRGIKFGPQSEEHRNKIGAAHRGKKLTPEQCEAMSKRLKGRVMSPEWCAKIAKANTGRKMAPLSDAHRAIVSATHKGKTISPEHREIVRKSSMGRPQSDETRAKRSASITAWWAARKAQGL